MQRSELKFALRGWSCWEGGKHASDGIFSLTGGVVARTSVRGDDGGKRTEVRTTGAELLGKGNHASCGSSSLTDGVVSRTSVRGDDDETRTEVRSTVFPPRSEMRGASAVR